MIEFFKKLIPPFFVDIVVYFFNRRNKFDGIYDNWEDAKINSVGYNDDLILSKVISANRKCLNDNNLFERDSILFLNPQYSHFINTYLLFILSKSGRANLNVLDFGGALGTTYRQFKHIIKGEIIIKWGIIEQDKLLRIGENEFANDELYFISFDEILKSDKHFDVVIFSGVIEFLEKPFEILNSISLLNVDYVLIDRSSFWQGDEHLLSNLIAAKQIGGSYPCYIFSEMCFNKEMSINWELINTWDSLGEKIHLKKYFGSYKGQIWKKK